MGSRAPKSETTIKSPDPLIVREWMSPRYLRELGNLAEYYGTRSLQERSTYQNMVNNTMSSYGREPLFSKVRMEDGTVIKPGQVSAPYELSNLVNAAEKSGMFDLPKENKTEKKEDARTSYSQLLKNRNSKIASMPRMTGGG